MTPLEIEILLHYHTRANDWRDGDFSAPIVNSTLEAFMREDLLTLGDDRGHGRKYSLTARGTAYCKALQRVPLPKLKWVVPGLEELEQK